MRKIVVKERFWEVAAGVVFMEYPGLGDEGIQRVLPPCRRQQRDSSG
jgi:hypothetical protein